jgi:hypothetical protein
MKPAPFDYFAPTSVEETCALLARHGDNAKILAGGQSLVPLLALRLTQPEVQIDINPLRELDYIQANSDGLSEPTVMEIPAIEIEHLETPPISPVNFRGVGEGDTICAPPAIVNAISDALDIKITEQPLPPTRILEIMRVIPEEK